jgi:hypothetical protein
VLRGLTGRTRLGHGRAAGGGHTCLGSACRVRQVCAAGACGRSWAGQPRPAASCEDPARPAGPGPSVPVSGPAAALERPGPPQRALFVPHAGSGAASAQAARAVGRAQPACRRAAVRARRHPHAERPRFHAGRGGRERSAGRFFGALREKDPGGRRGRPGRGVRMIGDSGGTRPRPAARGGARIPQPHGVVPLSSRGRPAPPSHPGARRIRRSGSRAGATHRRGAGR